MWPKWVCSLWSNFSFDSYWEGSCVHLKKFLEASERVVTLAHVAWIARYTEEGRGNFDLAFQRSKPPGRALTKKNGGHFVLVRPFLDETNYLRTQKEKDVDKIHTVGVNQMTSFSKYSNILGGNEVMFSRWWWMYLELPLYTSVTETFKNCPDGIVYFSWIDS